MLKPKHYFVLSVIFAIIAIAPILCALLAQGLSNSLTCVVNERGDTPCILFNYDITMILVSFYVSGWIALLTIPIAGGMSGWCYLHYLKLSLIR
ncbi:hypothetical protein [Pseudoalteromonas luteoviolacea]|uniref:Uncharacterized protein n=1 Tax=Pseudoalteromonas luteoviolacea S4054 TaxID=1129367 RepID=A0A0F6A4T0_9GAMM|nr:hypothetical protein [Pseudoalteromonas luteoviolacea]AOT06589.1 hypothetical protein S4054249_01230 [Pseudoalteromonas luteoviolacea]AOT11506.1 hypothetical protein S40542_01230 [Pseudoalteromonas luteoviolacea]AOT16419.1 hypothetical protein S4054_01230 [Pseudoalteromonas luteoviolacea]KKE81093.1 hypothetical protein N479_03540 [Pseudoalteromonas luteoviolacea S4054]KZN62499.1 hypothetical protein N481_03395 [Pseudoalteromonas luteoviolacea S4047-1]